ncbi:MAG: hypothetical protein IPN34_19435 [Planctomycetes bacterium]|nr:hypothetical protein [Planctomycetota bacterium]
MLAPVVRRALPAFALLFSACAAPSTQQELESRTGLSSSEMAELRAQKGLDDEDFRRLAPERLRKILARIREPRPDHPGEYQEWRLESLRDENGAIPPDADLRAKEQMLALQLEGVAGGLDSLGWTDLGPGNIGGRSRTVAIHPTTPSIMLIGSVAGGIWRTANGGTSWQVVDDLMANLAITSIQYQPLNPSIVYAATGEGFRNADSVRGAGIFKSTDGGASWARLSATNSSDFHYVTRLGMTADGANLLAATRTGIYRSTNGGASFAKVHGTTSARCLDLKTHPTNAQIAVAHWIDDIGGAFSTVAYTTNAGATWSESSGIRTTSSTQRAELAWHKGWTGAGNGCVYAMKDQGSGASTLYRSVDGGASFAVVGTSSILGGQGWYDNALWVDPSDLDANTADDVVVAGGIDLWRSTNGGSSFTKISEWSSWPNSAHADQHYIVEHPQFNGTTNRSVYFCNDGGIWRTDNIYTVARTSGWVNLNRSLGITQFYGGSRHEGSGILVGGTQDNGTLRRNEASGYDGWTTMFGGDGGFCASDAGNSSYHFGEYVNLRIHRSTNGGSSASYIYSGISDAGSAANFIAPFVLDPNDSRRMLAGGLSLWRCSDTRAGTPSWTAIKPSTGSNISAIAVVSGDANTIWVGHNDGAVYRTSNGTAASPIWTRVDTNAPGLPDRKVLRLGIDPANAQRVFACFGGYSTDNLWETTNAGTNWTAKPGLPDAPVRDVEFHPTRSQWLYLATEVGLLVSENGGTMWSSTATPARASIDELFWSGGALYLVTHGRGILRQAPLGLASTTRVGVPCRVNGPLSGPTLNAGLPALGAATRFDLANLPPGAPAWLLASPVPPAPLPLSPGCELQVTPLALFNLGSFTLLVGQPALFFLPLPAEPYLAGSEVMTQAIAIDGADLLLSDGQRLLLGY